MNRPDDGPETLGLHIIDEPAAQQSDPTVLGIQLRSISKQTTTKQVAVKSIPDPDANPKVKHCDFFSGHQLCTYREPQIWTKIERHLSTTSNETSSLTTAGKCYFSTSLLKL